MRARRFSTEAAAPAAPAAAAAPVIASSVQSMAQCMNSVVKVFTTSSSPNYLLPWQNKPLTDCSGSGFLISGRRIITNAHVVADAVQVMVRRPGSATKFVASVVAAGHECDLAVLTVADEEFWRPGEDGLGLDDDGVDQHGDFADVSNSGGAVQSTNETAAPATPAASGNPSVLTEVYDDPSAVVGADGSLRFSPELPLLQDSVCVIGYPSGGDNLCVTQVCPRPIALSSRFNNLNLVSHMKNIVIFYNNIIYILL